MEGEEGFGQGTDEIECKEVICMRLVLDTDFGIFTLHLLSVALRQQASCSVQACRVTIGQSVMHAESCYGRWTCFSKFSTERFVAMGFAFVNGYFPYRIFGMIKSCKYLQGNLSEDPKSKL